jgi:Transposase
MPVADICRKAGISQATYFYLKRKYDGLLPTEMRRLKQLEDENSKLRKVQRPQGEYDNLACFPGARSRHGRHRRAAPAWQPCSCWSR